VTDKNKIQKITTDILLQATADTKLQAEIDEELEKEDPPADKAKALFSGAGDDGGKELGRE